MKRAYGQYVFAPAEIRDHFFKARAEGGMEAIKALVRRKLADEKHFGVQEYQVILEAALIMKTMDAEQLMLEGHGLHLFFRGDHFQTWLESAAPPMVEEQAHSIHEFCASHGPVILHFPGGNTPAHLVMTEAPNNILKHPLVFIGRGYRYSGLMINPPATTQPDPHGMRPAELVSGAMAYIQAFPEQMRQGIPEDLKHPNHFRKAQTATVTPAPSLIERGGPCPHYRVGHFRMLLSERFVNKKGQVIFVRGTFVKGQAKTVLSPEENMQ